MSKLVTKPFRTVSLSYKVLGMGTIDPPKPPIIIFHGILGHKAQWSGVGKTILNLTRQTVVVVDLRNHGESPHVDSHKYPEQATDVLHLLEKLGAHQATLIGYSIGGRTAMSAALIAPQKIAGLLVIGVTPVTTPPHYKEDVPKLLKAMKAVNFKNVNMISKAKAEVRTQLKEFNSNEAIMQSVLSNIRRRPDGTVGWICNLDVLLKHYKHWTSFPEKLKQKKYDGPTLFIAGQFSKTITPEELTAIRLMFPQAVVTYVQNAGHRVHVDNPETFLQLIISFLKKLDYKKE